MRRDEVLQHGQALAEIRRDRCLDDLAGRLRHQTAHPGQLANLLLAAARTGIGHDEDRIEITALLIEPFHPGEHFVGDPFGDIGPDGDDLVVALAVGNRTLEVLLLDLDDVGTGVVDELRLLRRDDQVVDANREARLGRREETQVLDPVEHVDGHLQPEAEIAVLHELLQPLLLEQAIDER